MTPNYNRSGQGQKDFRTKTSNTNSRQANTNSKPALPYKELTNENYVEIAENVIKSIKNNSENIKKNDKLTTTQIRNLLAMTADIYNEVILFQDDKLSEDICGRIEYLKVRFIYAAVKKSEVRSLADEAHLIQHIEAIKGSKKNYILFSHYMEALVAYHRYYFGEV